MMTKNRLTSAIAHTAAQLYGTVTITFTLIKLSLVCVYTADGYAMGTWSSSLQLRFAARQAWVSYTVRVYNHIIVQSIQVFQGDS